LQSTCRVGCDTFWHVFGAKDTKSALRGAHCTLHSLDLNTDLVRAATSLWILVVAARRRWWGRWRWSTSLGTCWIGRLRCDTTLVLVSHHPDVALLPPTCTPRILHFPIVFAICSITDNKDTVVKLFYKQSCPGHHLCRAGRLICLLRSPPTLSAERRQPSKRSHRLRAHLCDQ